VKKPNKNSVDMRVTAASGTMETAIAVHTVADITMLNPTFGDLQFTKKKK
jgi:hypothetical protein